MPENGQSVKIAFKKSVIGFAEGEAARNIIETLDNPKILEQNKIFSRSDTGLPMNVLVVQNFTFKIVSVAELDMYTPFRKGSLLQRQYVALPPATLQLFGRNSVHGEMKSALPLVIVYPALFQVIILLLRGLELPYIISLLCIGLQ